MIAVSVSVIAQSPPAKATNIVELTPATKLAWDQVPDVAGYWATMKRQLSTSEIQVWRAYTTNTFMPLATLSSNISSGNYQFEVRAVNAFGTEGPPGLLSTNLSATPPIILNVRFEGTITIIQ